MGRDPRIVRRFPLSQPNPTPRGNDGVQGNVLDGLRFNRTDAGRVRSLSHPRRGGTGSQKTGFGYLLRYEHIIGDNEDIQEVRCIFVELPAGPVAVPARLIRKLHTRCATCGETAIHDEAWQAEVWADIHEFEHSRHRVRLFEQTRADGLKEIADWRDTCA